MASAGEQLRRDVLDTWSLTVAEERLLDAAAATLDAVAELEERVAADGTMTVGSKGQPVLHPGVPELRQQRLALGRLLAALALPDPEGSVIRTPQAVQATARAQARWRQQRRRDEVIYGDPEGA